MQFTDEQKANLNQSIVLMGPCGVGKSLLGKTLAEKVNLPLLDIDVLINLVDLDLMGALSPDPEKQNEFTVISLMKISQATDTPDETDLKRELVAELVQQYNDYRQLLGDFKKFHRIIYDYCRPFKYQHLTKPDRIYDLNLATNRLLKKIFTTTDTPFVIAAPGTLGWHDTTSTNPDVEHLQKEIGKLLHLTRNVLLQPGQDFAQRSPAENQKGPAKRLLQHQGYYYKNADLMIATNGLFNQPDHPYFRQRQRFDLCERLTKKLLQNTGEINNICDQIMEHLGNDFTKAAVRTPQLEMDTLSR